MAKILSFMVSVVFLAIIIGLYLLLYRRRTRLIERKIRKAKEYGLHEPVSIHPYIDPSICIGSGACVKACPEKDVLGGWPRARGGSLTPRAA